MKRLLSIAIISVFGISGLYGQSFIEKASFHSWTGEGLLMGTEASFKMKWDWTLDNKFLYLEFQNSWKPSNRENVTRTGKTVLKGDVVLKAKAYYKPITNTEFEGTWFDSRGITFPVRGTLKDQLFTVIWGSEDTEQGKTEYLLLPSGQIEVKDYILNNGKYAQFGNAVYSKQ